MFVVEDITNVGGNALSTSRGATPTLKPRLGAMTVLVLALPRPTIARTKRATMRGILRTALLGVELLPLLPLLLLLLLLLLLPSLC